MFLWKAVSVTRFGSAGAAGVASVGRWSEGVTRSGEERMIQTWAGTSPEGLWSMGTHAGAQEEWGARSGTEELLNTHPNPLHCPFCHWRHWVWHLAGVPRRRGGVCGDAQPTISPQKWPKQSLEPTGLGAQDKQQQTLFFRRGEFKLQNIKATSEFGNYAYVDEGSLSKNYMSLEVNRAWESSNLQFMFLTLQQCDSKVYF